MEHGVVSGMDQQLMISTFLEIAAHQTVDTATQFLQASSWNLEEAIQLFYIENEGVEEQVDHNDVRPPLPVQREVLNDGATPQGMDNPFHEASAEVPFRNFGEESKGAGSWDEAVAPAARRDNSQDALAFLYQPPSALMFRGTFQKARDAARAQDKWLLVNLQSKREFSSHMLNRDTWANETISQIIPSYFIFWQAYDDTEEGIKVCTFYKLDSHPAVVVIDPVTGQKMRLWLGMVQPDALLEDLLQFMDGSPNDHLLRLSHRRPKETPPSTHENLADEVDENANTRKALNTCKEDMEETSCITLKDVDEALPLEACITKKPLYPPLPEEPKGDRNLLSRVGVRLPDGKRLQRNFLRTDPIQLLWSFCQASLDEADARVFRLAQAVPGVLKYLEYENKLTFEESGLSNSMISVTWA